MLHASFADARDTGDTTLNSRVASFDIWIAMLGLPHLPRARGSRSNYHRSPFFKPRRSRFVVIFDAKNIALDWV